MIRSNKHNCTIECSRMREQFSNYKKFNGLLLIFDYTNDRQHGKMTKIVKVVGAKRNEFVGTERKRKGKERKIARENGGQSQMSRWEIVFTRVSPETPPGTAPDIFGVARTASGTGKAQSARTARWCSCCSPILPRLQTNREKLPDITETVAINDNIISKLLANLPFRFPVHIFLTLCLQFFLYQSRDILRKEFMQS